MAVARDDEGRLVMVKRAASGPAADRLRHEAAALAMAGGAGCVELVELAEEDGGDVRLVTAWVGGGSLATALPPSPARVVVLARALAAALAELHRRGLAHGAVAPEHVLLDGDRPVLCGLGGARLPDDDGGASPEGDVAALLALIDGLVAGERGSLAERLRAVVTAGGGGGATAVADRLAVLAPSPGRRELRPRPEPRPARAGSPGGAPVRGLVVTASAAIVLLALALALATWRGGDRSPAAPAAPAPTTGPRCPAAVGAAADLDGDGCPEAVDVAGGVVTTGDRRWRVGGAGDVAAVADWDCDGRATAAVVRPATGEVWVYDGWASADRPVSAHAAAAAAPGATAARAVHDDEGCARLEVTTPTGDRRLLDLG